MRRLAVVFLVFIFNIECSYAGQSGQSVYEKACQSCHLTGVAGAPKKGDRRTWNKLKIKGMSKLVQEVKRGYKAMPPGGMCRDCNDQDYESAILFMMQAKPKERSLPKNIF
jgi:cytochrome c5